MNSASRKLILVLLISPVLATCFFPVGASLIPIEWVDEIENAALQVDLDTTAEIVVVVLQSLNGHGVKDNDGDEIHDIVKLGVYILNGFPLETYDGDTIVGIGKKGKDNGVLVLIAIDEQQWRIEVGYGLEGDITDIESNRIAQDYLEPQLRQGNYGEALYDTVAALAQQIPVTNQSDSPQPRGTYYYEQDATPDTNPDEGLDLSFWIIIIMIVLGVSVGVPVFRRTGRRESGGRSGGGGSTGKW
jgi:uncharacterized membrane protein YgcG